MIMGSRKQFKVGFESITNVSSKINIEVQAIHKTNKIVTVSFNPD